MELSWMGRYRELIRALVYYSNSSNRSQAGKQVQRDKTGISQTEYQVLEYICEFENDNKIMADVSRELGILPSIVTKSTKKLCELGLIEKYRLGDNHKSFALRPTDAGREMYVNTMNVISRAFDKFFSLMDRATDEELQFFEEAVRSLGADWGSIADEYRKHETEDDSI